MPSANCRFLLAPSSPMYASIVGGAMCPSTSCPLFTPAHATTHSWHLCCPPHHASDCLSPGDNMPSEASLLSPDRRAVIRTSYKELDGVAGYSLVTQVLRVPVALLSLSSSASRHRQQHVLRHHPRCARRPCGYRDCCLRDARPLPQGHRPRGC